MKLRVARTTRELPVVDAAAAVLARIHEDRGQIVRHRLFPFRGVVFDVDPEFNNTEEWYQSIPEDVRPRKDQPYYHLFAENSDSYYVAYVSEQNLREDGAAGPVGHPQIKQVFTGIEGNAYKPRPDFAN